VSSPAGGTVDPAVKSVIARLQELLRAQLAPLEALSARIVELIEADDDATSVPALRGKALDTLVVPVRETLRSSELAIGHGFIAAPGVVDGLERYMLWLQRRNGSIDRLRLNFDTGDLDAYDYIRMDWYTVAASHRLPTVTGPYLDYSGADQLVLTLTMPTVVDDHFIGVVGTDLLASATEELIAWQLCGINTDAVLVNGDRSVIATNSPRWMPGERLRIHPGADPSRFAAAVPLDEWTGWCLAVSSTTTP